MRLVAAHVERQGRSELIVRMEKRVEAAGNYCGLTGAEAVALRVLGLVAGLIIGAAAFTMGLGLTFAAITTGVGAGLIDLSLRAATQERQKKDRSRPARRN